jgi:sulfur relay (sulfurtransferase) complex TusBCD TusD component (DsrE family)
MQRNHKVLFATAIVAGVLAGVVFSLPSALAPAQAQHTDHMVTTESGSYSPTSGQAILVHITSGDPDDEHQVHSAMMGVEHAYAFQQSGKNVSIMLDVDGVRIAAKEVPTELDAINAELELFLDAGGRVIACSHCITNAGLTAENMLPGVEIDTHPTMPRTQNVLSSASVVLDY